MKRLAILSLFVMTLIASCKRENVYTYELNDVHISQEGAYKPNVKTDLEFISIAYTDLFGSTISSAELENMAKAYVSFGDKRLMIDMIILNWLNEPTVQVPTDADMRADIDGFVEATYQKFYIRQPTAFEKWYFIDKIEGDAGLSPDLVYYAFMTSNEYRYY